MFSFLPNSRYFGIQLGHHSVTAAYLGSFGKPKIKGVGVAPLERTPWLKNGLRDHQAVTTAIQAAVANAQPHPITLKQVVITLPESAVFTKALRLPKLSKKELLQTIPFEAADALPLPLEEVYLDWQIQTKPIKKSGADAEEKPSIRVLVVAVPKKTVDELIEIVHGAGLELVCVESEPFSIVRSLNHMLMPNATSIICNIDHEATTTIVASRNHITFTSTLLFGRKKIEHSHKEGAVRLAEEINESIKYYHNRLGEPESIKTVILTGEGSLLPGLAATLEKLTKLTCRAGYPSVVLPNASAIHPRFTTAIGASLWRKQT